MSESRTQLIQEDIDAILHAIAETDEIAQKKSKDRELVLVVGNTGAGKSVFVNYLLGNELIEERLPKELVKGIKCKNPAETDPVIGFGFLSQTKFPEFFNDPNSSLTFCDCPGFFDNRGAVFDISNMYAVAKMAASAKAVKGVVVLINYHSLMADRSRGLHETVSLLTHLFGSNSIQNNPSVLLLVTKAPADLERSELQEFMQGACEHFPALQGLVENCEMYDALDRYSAAPARRLDRKAICSRLQSFVGIEKDNLNVALSSDSQRTLDAMLRQLATTAVHSFDNHDSVHTNAFIGILNGLKILKCSAVTECLAGFFQHMTLKVSEWASELSNLDMLNDLKVEVAEIEEVVQVAINQMLQRIEAEKALNRKVEVAEEDLKLAKLESNAAKLKAAEAAEAVAAEKAKLQEEIEKHRKEIERLRSEAQRPPVNSPTQQHDPMLMNMLLAQMMNQQHRGPSMGYGGGGYDLSSQFEAMNMGRPSVSSSRSRPSSSGGGGGGGGRTWVAPYTRSNGVQVRGYYRRSGK